MPRKRAQIGRRTRNAQQVYKGRIKLAEQKRSQENERALTIQERAEGLAIQEEEKHINLANQKEERAGHSSLQRLDKIDENPSRMNKQHLKNKAPDFRESSKLSQTKYPCDQCSYKASTPYALQIHKIPHSGVKPFGCDQCDYRAFRISSVQQHKLTHVKSKHACKYCNFKTFYPGSMKAHMFTHSTIKPFCCDKCGYTATTKQNLKTHSVTHIDEKPFACDLCDFKTKHRATLKEHRLSHLNSKSFACDLCKYRAISKHRLRMHQKIHNKKKHPKSNGEKPKGGPSSKNEKVITDVETFIKISEDKRPKNSRVNKFWDIDNDLSSDESIKQEEDGFLDFPFDAESEEKLNAVDPSCLPHNKNEVTNTAALSSNTVKGKGEQGYDISPDEGVPRITPFILSLDPLREENYCSLDIHQDDDSDRESEQVKQEIGDFHEKEILEVEFVGDQKKKIYCDQCSRSYLKISALNYHIKVKHSETAYTCERCNFRASTPQALEKHKAVHSDVKPFACDQCDYRAACISTVKRHKRIHSEHKKYACDQCDYKTKFLGTLRQHKVTHSLIKEYKCTECDYLSYRKPGLKLHMSTKHSNLKPFTCKQCNYASKTKICLKVHLKTKHAENVTEHACEYCNFKTFHPGSMKVHMFTHSTIKPFCCDKCGYTSATKQNLHTHLLTHTDEKPFACDLCDFRTKLRVTLKEHRLTHFNSKPFACDLCKYRAISKHRLRMHQKIHNKKKLPKSNGEKQKRGPTSNNEKFITDVETFVKITEGKRPKYSLVNNLWDIDNDLIPDESIKNGKDALPDFPCHVESEVQPDVVDPSSLTPHDHSVLKVEALPTLILNTIKKEDEQVYDICCPNDEVSRITPSILSLNATKEENDGFDIHQDDDSDGGSDIWNQDMCVFVVEETKKIEFVGAQDKKFCCDKCGQSFNQSSALKVHILSKHNDTTYPCDQCSYKASTPQALHNHRVVHSDVKPFACDQCDYTAVCMRYVKQHKRMHNEQNLTCDQCEYKTNILQCLRQHKLTHLGIKQHTCPECDYVGLQKSDITRHISRKHSDKKPFTCDQCPYAAKIKRDLINHQFKHTGKLLSCDICDFKCSALMSMSRHMHVHKEQKTFSCGQCNYKTALKFYLKRHEKTHKVDKLYCCQDCDFKVNQRTEFRKHLAAHKKT